jgi:hypothetical protein
MSFVAICSTQLPRHLQTSELFFEHQRQELDDDKCTATFTMHVPDQFATPKGSSLYEWLHQDALSPEQITAFSALTTKHRNIIIHRLFQILQYWMSSSLPPTLQHAAISGLITNNAMSTILRKNATLLQFDIYEEMIFLCKFSRVTNSKTNGRGAAARLSAFSANTCASRRAAAYILSRGFIPTLADITAAALAGNVVTLQSLDRVGINADQIGRTVHVIPLMNKLAASGHVSVYKYIYELYQTAVINVDVCSAAYNGNIDMVRYLYDAGAILSSQLLEAAITGYVKGRVISRLKSTELVCPSCIMFLIEKHCPGINATNAFGHLVGPSEGSTIIERLVDIGGVECLQYLAENPIAGLTLPWNNPTNHYHALSCPNAVNGLQCMKLLYRLGCMWPNRIMSCAAYHNNGLEFIKFMYENGCLWGDTVLHGAVSPSCIRYMHEHGCPWPYDACDDFAEKGQLEFLQYAHESGCIWTGNECEIAAYNGHLDCLQYAHEHGCPWGDACDMAAMIGQFDCLKYAHEHGCPWTSESMIHAAKHHNTQCLEYMHKNDCPWNLAAYLNVLRKSKQNCAGHKYLLENGLVYY